MKKPVYFSIVLSNVLTYYDITIYGFLVPIFAKHFFCSGDSIVSIIKAYSFVLSGIITKPIGVFIFSKITSKIGPFKTVQITILGMAVSTTLMCFIPTYNQIGIIATILLFILRMIQNIFFVGETSISSIYLISKSKNKVKSSGYYNLAAMIGIILSSLISKIVVDIDENLWRIAFALSSLTSLAIFILRKFGKDDFTLKNKQMDKSFSSLINHKKEIMIIAVVMGFSAMTYSLPFVFLNSFVPEITNLNIQQMLNMNFYLIVLDTLIIMICIKLSHLLNIQQIMFWSSLILGISSPILFYTLQKANIITVGIVRIILVTIGVVFSSFTYAWMYKFVNHINNKYFVTGIGYNIGSLAIGRPTTFICLLSWYKIKSPIAPCIYIIPISLLTAILLYRKYDNN